MIVQMRVAMQSLVYTTIECYINLSPTLVNVQRAEASWFVESTVDVCFNLGCSYSCPISVNSAPIP